MDQLKTKLLLLHHWRGLGWTSIYKILKDSPSLSSIQQFTIAELQSIVNLPARCTPQKDLPIILTLNLLKEYEQNGIFPITIFDDLYPEHLKETYQPPWVLYAKGNVDLLKEQKKLAVVGARRATPYGKMAINLLFPELIAHDFVIVSGLAIGIDAHSHEMAMKYKGKTIGVIAGGFHHLYPKENQQLAAKMVQEHLLLSEYPPDTRPEKWHFPLRNRIISGMSVGTLVVEAEKKSGSLITANFALNEGREVFAIPGSILNPQSMGTNELIQQGAKLVKSAKDIINELSY